MPDVNWRLRRPFHVCRRFRLFVVYKTDNVHDGGWSASPTDYSYGTYEQARAKADELNRSYRVSGVGC